MKAAFYTLGCKVNQYETQALSEQFRAKGFQIVPPEEEADVYLVNSCTVTGTGDQKSRQAVRRFKRLQDVYKRQALALIFVTVSAHTGGVD